MTTAVLLVSGALIYLIGALTGMWIVREMRCHDQQRHTFDGEGLE